MNDEDITSDDKLSVFIDSFSKLGDAEVVTPAGVADSMCSNLSDDCLYNVIGSGARVIDFSSETGEFSFALLRRFEELGVFTEEASRSICAIPASPLAYECTRKAYELLGLDADNIYRFTVYDLLKAIESDSGGIDESKIAHVSDILKQAKKPCNISLDDVVEDGADKVEITAIVGNPPYQDSNTHMRLYPAFYKMSIRIANISIMIFPDGWQKPKNANGLKQMNNLEIKRDSHIVCIKNMIGVFDGVTGAETVNIVYWDRSIDNGYDGKQLIYGADGSSRIAFIPIEDTDIEKPKVIKDIVTRIMSDDIKSVMSLVTARKPYGFCADPLDNPTKYGINPTDEPIADDDVRLVALNNRRRASMYIRRSTLPKESHNLDCYKVFIPKAWANMSKASGYLGGSYSETIVASPSDCCSETYVEFGPFETLEQAISANKYLHTKFFRAMFFYNKKSQNTPRATYSCIPLQDFSSSSDINWSKSVEDIDSQLYLKYGLSDDEIKFIEQNIQPMD